VSIAEKQEGVSHLFEEPGKWEKLPGSGPTGLKNIQYRHAYPAIWLMHLLNIMAY